MPADALPELLNFHEELFARHPVQILDEGVADSQELRRAPAPRLEPLLVARVHHEPTAFPAFRLALRARI